MRVVAAQLGVCMWLQHILGRKVEGGGVVVEAHVDVQWWHPALPRPLPKRVKPLLAISLLQPVPPCFTLLQPASPCFNLLYSATSLLQPASFCFNVLQLAFSLSVRRAR
eukprot:365520-Chlamydomonas_euryale.AAC.1